MSYLVGNLNRIRKIFCPPAGNDAVLDVIVDETLESASTFTVDNIPQNYDHLLIFITARSNLSYIIDDLGMYYNDDLTHANYHADRKASRSSLSLASHTSNPSIYSYMPGNTAPAGEWGRYEITIPYYANSDFTKVAICRTAQRYNTNDMENGHTVHFWNNTAPITKLFFRPIRDYPYNELFLAASNLQVVTMRGI